MQLKSYPVLFLLSLLPLRGAEYYVATNGTDTASGTATHPFRTIQKGIATVTPTGGTVIVQPGVYAEELLVQPRDTTGGPITLKAAQRQTVILDGAERVSGWRLVDPTQNVWEKAFGTKAPYNNDRGRWDLAPRSEQLFVNGQRCVQVKEETPYGAMSNLSFTATLHEPARYVLKLPQNVQPDTAVTEITVKTNLLNVRGDNLVIDGFVFRRVRNTYQNAMVTLRGDGIEFRNNLLEYSSAGSGLAIQTKRSHFHDNIFRHNGQFGFSMGGGSNLVENNLVQGNDLAGYKEWGTGGTKVVGNSNILRRNRFIGNLGGVAIWLDCGPTDNVIEYNCVSGNYGEGIRAEISFHSYIGYNIVENTKSCTSTMFGRTQTHCIGISVQNSAEICVVNNLVRDNDGVGIQLATYNRPGDDLAKWQERNKNESQRQWLRRSWADKVVYAYSNLFFNNAVIQGPAEGTNACVYVMGLLNHQKPHCYGNQFDYNFYWNSATHAPKVRFKNSWEIPNGKSEWQTRYGMDTHALGGFSLDDYRQRPFAAEYPYKPAATFGGIGKGKNLKDLPWPIKRDYLGELLDVLRKPSMGHIEAVGK